MKISLIALASLAALSATAMQAQAADGTINFTGKVEDVTCTIQVNGAGTGDGAVTLPTVSKTSLKGIGTTGGDTNFSIKLSNCTPADSANGLGVAVFFEPGTNVTDAGRLKNTGAGAEEVDLAIYKQGEGSALQLGAQPTQKFVDISGLQAEMPFTVKYYSNAAEPSSGEVESSVTYSIVYP
ncbi:type 1 fimbrial protein [Pseudomonas sp. GD04087]|uniref:fimbrial protein n=1 Tax=unclassified Pseudomonas TaxID=196821 RepID=UPI00244B2662|nr:MULTISPECIES: fimbrial protein [unclassified Pseudomonas]MDH0291350.1 type 1 fimbrial protein [Pseudomonas sp. GD04087]MDH1049433.1 type 1 fimbrial protein [Pseudomonas sp. GD03903]MDH2000073.1 type 1 fimbrial protein [Pseudomonas sp. GD03691]